MFGKYKAYDNGDDSYIYDMEIAWVENTYNRITITNLWDGGETITATVDFENKQIILDLEPLIGDFSAYGLGLGYIYSIDEAGNPIMAPIVCTYDADGNIAFPDYLVYMTEAGPYTNSYTDMVKVEEEEE